jgi:hypothetical protein
MLNFGVACILLAAGQEGDGRALVREAARRTRYQSSYRIDWTARLAGPLGDPLDYRGSCVWAAPGVLYSHHTATGGEERNSIRVGSSMAWVHSPLPNLWLSADEAGDPEAGRGLQHPDEVLALLARSRGPARTLERGGIEFVVRGGDLPDLLRGRVLTGNIDLARSHAVLRLSTDTELRLRTLEVDATLVSADPRTAGDWSYRTWFAWANYNGDPALEFRDGRGRPLGLPRQVTAQIRSLRALKLRLSEIQEKLRLPSRSWPCLWS